MSAPNPGSVAVVTGAGRGVGQATAIALASVGHAVGPISHSAAELELTCNEILGRGGTAVTAAADVTDAREVDPAFDRIGSALGAWPRPARDASWR